MFALKGIVIRHFLLFVFSLSIFGINSVGYCDFEYEWIADQTHQGQESFTPVDPLKVEINGRETLVSDSSASLTLQHKYNVYLNQSWTDSDAYILSNIFNQLDPPGGTYNETFKSLWIQVPFNLPDDIVIIPNQEGISVLVAKQAVYDAETMIAEIDGVKGKLFSKRLHRVVLRYLHHTIPGYLDSILLDRFGIEIRPWHIPYEYLTRNTTGETSERFETFKDEEKIYLINMLEEFPDGMLKIPGLKYILRRKDGLTHPRYPSALAIAWTGAGYIEFMYNAFDGRQRESIYRLILHEKAHFLWTYLFDDKLKQDWIELGGWFENPDDPNGWSTTDETRFVSDYAHNVNPNEDMAESISFYITNPDKLRTNAPKKYEFLQNRIMHGTRYISKIREDLTFRVYNLYPDYTYPARVKRIYVKITGEPEEDKNVFIEIEIDSKDGLDNATTAYMSLINDGVYKIGVGWFKPYKNGSILRYTTTMSKYLKSGYWYCGWLKIEDQIGNIRITEPPNIGWKFYLDNPLEDLEPPKYIEGSCKITINRVEKTGDGKIYYVKISWDYTENTSTGQELIIARIGDPNPEKYVKSLGYYNYRNKPSKFISANVIIPVNDYNTNGTWKLSSIAMTDIAGNKTELYEDDLNLSIFIDTKNEDNIDPIIDVDNISIEATPTNIEYPNGETNVKVVFYIKEEHSGINAINIGLRDPLGKHYGFWFNPIDLVNETDLKSINYIECTANILLPVGSAPGIWGISGIYLRDKADNVSTYDFTTIVRFEVDELVSSAPTIIQNALLANYPNPCNPDTWIPYQIETLSNVSITIYSVNGLIIRRLNLGMKNPGKYLYREKAAYWDGKNESGESVSSGIYFYNLKAGDFTATRKMLIQK